MNPTWTVEIPCPQCGGPVSLEAGDPVLACGYCRTRLYLAMDGGLRYRLPADPGRVGGRPLLYLPFWRFRGLRYRVLSDPVGVEGSLLDATVPACSTAPAGVNLGVRPQVVALEIDAGERCALPTDRPSSDAVEEAQARTEAFQERRPLFTRLIGETVCRVLAPCVLDGGGNGDRLLEALADPASHPLSPEQAESFRSAASRPGPGGSVYFLPLVCPECGSDLPAAPGAAAMLCPHCCRAWRVRGRTLAPLPYAVLDGAGRGARYFPFWQIAFEAQGLPASNRAELRRWAVPYQPAPSGWQEQPCQLWVPGFKLQPHTFLRVARILSLAPLQVPARSPGWQPAQVEAQTVRLPLREAVESLAVALVGLARDRGRAFAEAADSRIRVRRARLVFLPFQQAGAEWVQEQTGVALQTASVERGASL